MLAQEFESSQPNAIKHVIRKLLPAMRCIAGLFCTIQSNNFTMTLQAFKPASFISTPFPKICTASLLNTTVLWRVIAAQNELPKQMIMKISKYRIEP